MLLGDLKNCILALIQIYCIMEISEVYLRLGDLSVVHVLLVLLYVNGGRPSVVLHRQTAHLSLTTGLLLPTIDYVYIRLMELSGPVPSR